MLSEVKQRLNDVAAKHQVLSQELDPTKQSRFLDFYVRLIPRVLNAERCSIFVHDLDAEKVWLKAGTSLRERGIEVSVDDSIVGEVIKLGKPLVRVGLEERQGAHKSTDVTTGFVTREVICVPIHSSDGSEVTGAIQVLNKKDKNGFTAADESFLAEVGEHFQSIVESIFLGQETHDVARDAVAVASRATRISYIWSGISIAFLGLFGLALSLSLIKIGSGLAGL